MNFFIICFFVKFENLATAGRPLGEAPLHARAPGALAVPGDAGDVPLHLESSS